MKSILALLCLLASLFAISAPAHAATLTASCVAPTKFSDGSPITTAIAYKFYGALQGQPKSLLNATAATSCSYQWTVTTPAIYCVEVTAIALGAESDHSTESCVAVVQPKPNAPSGTTLVTVTVSIAP